MKKLGLGLSIIAVSMAVISCGNKTTAQYPGYDKVEEGLYVKYVTQNKEARKVAVGDILTMSMKYGTEDSTLFDTELNGQPIQLRADTGKYVGDILTAFMSMGLGDSASIIVNADSFFMKTAGMPSSPDFIDSAAMLYFSVGLTNIQSMEEMQAEADAKNAEAEANEMVIFNKYSAGSIEVALGAGLKMSSYAISQGTEEQFTVSAGYKVTSSEPLVFEVKRTLKDSILIDRYSYDATTSIITHLKGLDCKNCIGGQKIAFDMSANGGARYKFCSGPVF